MGPCSPPALSFPLRDVRDCPLSVFLCLPTGAGEDIGIDPKTAPAERTILMRQYWEQSPSWMAPVLVPGPIPLGVPGDVCLALFCPSFEPFSNTTLVTDIGLAQAPQIATMRQG